MSELENIEAALRRLEVKENELDLERQSLTILKNKLLKPEEWNHEKGWFIWRALFFHPDYINCSAEWYEFKYAYERDEVLVYHDSFSSAERLNYKLEVHSKEDSPCAARTKTINALRNNTIDGTVELYKPEKLITLPIDLQAYLQEKMP